MYIIGVDLGGTQIRAGLFAENGTLLRKEITLTHAQEGPDAVIDRIKKCIYQVCVSLKGDIPKNVIGIGIGCPGPLNAYTGIVLSPPNLPGWDAIPLKEQIELEFGIPVYLNNDANAAALGEFYFGSGKGAINLVYMTISTGIGSGVITDGKLLMGELGTGAEFGHMVLNPTGPKCGCGNNGCFEAYASGTGILNRTLEAMNNSAIPSTLRKKEKLQTKDIFDAAKQEDVLAKEILAETIQYLGIGLANVINLYNPKKIILGGGVTKAGASLLQPAIELAKNIALSSMGESVEFHLTQLGEDVGLIGAAALVNYHKDV